MSYLVVPPEMVDMVIALAPFSVGMGVFTLILTIRTLLKRKEVKKR